MPSSLFDATDDLPTLAYLPDVAKLLSASSYPHAPTSPSIKKASGEKLLFGGLVAAQDSAEEDEVEARPKKRSKSNQKPTSQENENSQEAPKRQRGRPKVSTRDETAAERRRTQIRLAQRAYRNRKENTIAELNQKVEGLQTALKTLNTGVTRLHEDLVSMGIVQANEAVAQQIDEILRQLSHALESPSPDGEKMSSEEDDGEIQGQEAAHDQNQFGLIVSETSPTAMQGQTFPDVSVPAPGIYGNLLGASADQIVLDLEGQNLTDFQNFPALPTNYHTSFVSTTNVAQGPNNHITPSNNLALTSIDRFPSRHSYTYSFQETSFERRLHRFCLERAYQRLVSPHTDPEWLFRTFRLTFNFSNKERLTQGFKKLLERGTDEPLENWSIPWVNLGGAGTHFPRRDVHGNPIYPPNMLAPRRAFSTWRQAKTELEPPADTFEDILQAIGFEGEWFDSRDVEGYLMSRGIYPEPHSSFFVVDTALLDFPASMGSESTGTTTSSSISTPWSHQSLLLKESVHEHGSSDAFEVTAGFDALPAKLIVAPTTNNAIDNWLGEQQTYALNDFDLELQQPASAVPPTNKRFLTIEVEKILERLSDNSACLGRAPGFRKQHVDMALSLAIQEAF